MATEAETPESTQNSDDLSKPLGTAGKRKRAFVIPTWIVSRAIAGALGLLVAVLIGWIMFVGPPSGGEARPVVGADTRGSTQTAKPGEKPGESPAAKPGSTPAALADGEKPGQ